MISVPRDSSVRRQAFAWLQAQVNAFGGDVLPRELLTQGFVWEDVRVPLLGPQGIFKPRVLDIPLSIATIPSGPYDDGFSAAGQLLYLYRGADTEHRDNVGLRTAMKERIPLVYFYRVVPGKYFCVWPVFIVGDDPATFTFTVEVDDISVLTEATAFREYDPKPRRSYITATVRQRVHQRAFRERILRAYRSQCAMCHLRHEELLDAAHIIPDNESGGEPVVSNGLALCKFHHAAFDRMFLGIRPDYRIEIRPSILEETDGPMLDHGLKKMDGRTIIVPASLADRPDPRRLEQRYEKFRSVSR